MTMTASEVKRKFGEALEAARRDEVVIITRRGKPVAALIDIKEYERLRQSAAVYWAYKMEKAGKSGYLRPEESIHRGYADNL